MPGTSMAQAADIVMGETGDMPHLPQLPDRGLGSDAVGRTASLLPDLGVDRGPRAWRLTARPQIATRRTWDRLERDLDEVQEVWGENVPVVKVQALGPWSLAASLELSNGHRALSDAGAVEDLCAALQEGLAAHKEDVARCFHGRVLVQLDEPWLDAVIAGRVPGTTDFDILPAVPAEVAAARLAELGADFVRAAPQWEIAAVAPTFLTEFAGLDSARNLDGLGEYLTAGGRIGFGLEPSASRDARAAAIALARHWDTLGLDRALMVEAVDVYPARVSDAARDLRFAHEVAGIIDRDAGDL